MEFEQLSYLRVAYGVLQASLATFLVAWVGYAAAGTRILGPDTSLALRRIATALLLPALAVLTLGSEVDLKMIIRAWPIAAVTVGMHLLSLFVSYFIFHRAFGVAPWIVESLSFNSLSLPLLILAGLSQTPSVLHRLQTDETDTPTLMLKRGVVYLLLTGLVSGIVKAVFSPFLPKPKAAIFLPEDDEEVAALPVPVEEDQDEHEPEIEPMPTERTSLLSKSAAAPSSSSAPIIHTPVSTGFWSYVNAFLIFSALGLVLALVPGVQSAVFGHKGGALGDGRQTFGILGATLGTTLGWLGAVFAVVEVLGAGGSLRLGDGTSKQAKTLGAVLSIFIWRIAAMPALTSVAIWGIGHIKSDIIIRDPIFAFSLVLFHSLPSLVPASPIVSSHQTLALLQIFILAPFLVSLSLAAGVAVTGQGVVFESNVDWVKALKLAAGGGIAGAAAMVCQVLTLMPMRTLINYQYRYGGSMKASAKILWSQGKLPRFYAGLGAALFQGPLSRFGDTAANAGILAVLESVNLPVVVKTVFSSAAAATFRMALTPIDTLKTTQQTQGGRAGVALLRQRIRDQGVASLWYGALATAAATFVGNFPWFATYNYLSEVLPPPHDTVSKLARQAFIGFVASIVSDTCSNSLRVIKTYRQVHEGDVGYIQAAKEIIAKDGVLSLFGRGLGTKILSNGVQGLLFSMLWKLFADLIAGKQ